MNPSAAPSRTTRRIDCLVGASTARLECLTGETLATDLDPVLQALVAELAVGLKMPTAAVSLVLTRTQYFRAHHNLPPELATARATDRDASFCQFVVRDSQRFEVTNALEDDRIPTEVVERYGVRAYIGEPIRIGDAVVGALCSIDGAARTFSDADRVLIAALADRVSARLAELALLRTAAPAALLSRAVTPAFSELRNIVGPIECNLAMARVALTDLGALVRLSADLPPDVVARMPAYGSLGQAAAAFDDLTDIVADLERSAARLMPMLVAIEHLTIAARESTLIADVVTTASSLAHHHTKLVGGVRWAPTRRAVEVATTRVVAVAIVSATLSVLCAAMKGAAGGIDGAVTVTASVVAIALRAELDAAGLTACAAEVQQLIGATGGIAVTVAPGWLELRFPRADRVR